jgi:hypothetical protein
MINDALNEAGITTPAANVELQATNPTVNGLTGALTLFADGSEEAAHCDFDLFSYVIPGVVFGPAMLIGRN